MSDEKTSSHIKIMPNGPYIVSGSTPLTERYPDMSTSGEPLVWDPVGAEVKERPIQEKYALCRCGQSQNKPFCDGSHARLGFDGTLTADRTASSTRRKVYKGSDIVMTDDESLCEGAGFCGTRLTNVWKMIERTNNPEVRARLIEMAQNCPSGRLQVSKTEGGELLEPEFEQSIATVPDGPLWVRGGIPVEASDGFTYAVRQRVTLCRCGQSNNKPFCDGSHEQVKFNAPKQLEEIFDRE